MFNWSLAGRVHCTLVTLAAVAFVWLLNYWNLLGFRYQALNVVKLARRSRGFSRNLTA